MQAISLKLDKGMLKEIDEKLSKHRYSTRTEFIRDAIRIRLSDLEKEEMIRKVAKLRGISKRRTTDEELHRVREEVVRELENKFK